MLTIVTLIFQLFTAEAASSPVGQIGSSQAKVIVVTGASGEEEYGNAFAESADLWKKTTTAAQMAYLEIGRSPGGTNDLELLEKALLSEPKGSLEPLWLVFLGHGTFDGKIAKFNLRGADLASTNLAAMLRSFTRPIITLQCASASGPFLNELSGTNRVVVTATRSGSEQNYARFGTYISQAISDLRADLDKDGQVSVLEAFLYASRQVEDFYKTEGRLATEHALLDDNGDSLGTGASFFRGIRVVKKPAASTSAKNQTGLSVDGLRAHQIHLIESDFERNLPPEVKEKRNNLELQIEALREKKTSLEADAYYSQLEELLIELSLLYQGIQQQP
ncbi:MAG: hypothetical protein ACO1QB_09490 [Verrucomicrobiales bacterium]